VQLENTHTPCDSVTRCQKGQFKFLGCDVDHQDHRKMVQEVPLGPKKMFVGF